MSKAYFSKVSNTMSWNELKSNISEQKKHGLKPLPYEILTEIIYPSLKQRYTITHNGKIDYNYEN